MSSVAHTSEPVKAVHFSLQRLFGSDDDLGTAYSGWLVQFGASGWGPTPRWRAVWFSGDQAMARKAEVPWHELEPLHQAILAFCTRPLDVKARFDTSGSWETIELAIGVNGRASQRLSLSMRSSGFEGADAALLARLLDTVEARAGITHSGPPAW